MAELIHIKNSDSFNTGTADYDICTLEITELFRIFHWLLSKVVEKYMTISLECPRDMVGHVNELLYW